MINEVIEYHANKQLAEAEKIIKQTINYLEKKRCYQKADELRQALITINSVDIEVA